MESYQDSGCFSKFQDTTSVFIFPYPTHKNFSEIKTMRKSNETFIFSHKFLKAVQTSFEPTTYLYWYELMLLLRRFEEKAGQLYGMQKIRGFCHLYIGQEAVAAGIMSAIREQDNIITGYREHGLAIAKGISAKECMAELYGKATGCSKGKGGSMHFFSKEIGRAHV
jgi:TPP-dependent pyruvate/acetoin dehydrogenase alpha subunit